MFEQATPSAGAAFGYAVAVPPPPPRPAAYELRPLSTGEIFDRTFSLYRQRFWLYCGLAALAAGLQTLTSLAQLIFLSGKVRGVAAASTAANPTRAIVVGVVVGLLVSLIYFAAYSVTQAATFSAVLSVYLGHETSMGQALRAVRGHWWRYVLILLWQFWSAAWVPFALIVPAAILVSTKIDGLSAIGGLLMIVAFFSFIYGVIAYIRNSLAIAASVMEGSKVRASMRRSKTLAAGNKWRIFLLLLMLAVLGGVAGGIQLPFVILLQHSHAGEKILAQGLSLALAFVTNSLIGPIGAIGFCLFYIDARVRKEGFDIEALMDPTLGSSPRAAVVAEPVVLTASGFAPSGFTAAPVAPPVSPSGAAPSSPFAPSGFTSASAGPGGPPAPTPRPGPEMSEPGAPAPESE